MMITFEKSEYWWYILAVLLLVLYFIKVGRDLHQLFNLTINANTLKKIIPNFRLNRWYFKISLILLGILMTTISLLNPQKGLETMTVKANGVDVYIALDISNSMYAADIQPNRMERAKKLSQNIIEGMIGNRVGLIYFAGNAYLQMPISPDKALALNLINAAGPQQAGNQGTDISEAIKIATKTYDENNTKNRVLVIITDGEDHDENAIAEAKKAKDEGLNIIAVGIGSENGTTLTLPTGEPIMDESGNVVITKANPKLIKSIADEGSDFYLNAVNGSVSKPIIDKINNMSSGPVKSNAYAQRKSLFQWPLGLGILLIVIGYFMPLFQTIKN
ncbi:MAG TPA: VWA domain-containing protein [Saprospiraceae bacterium]|nr:VWA domain-containing protein [Saprospiraceae bacterium]